MKIIEYTTVRDEAVDDCLKKGWQLYGNPMYVARTDEIIQAMVRYEEEKAIFNPPYPIIEPGKIYEEYHSEATIRDEVDRRARDYQKYWNTGTNMYEIFKGERGEWICTQQELLAYIEKSVRWEMGK